MKIGTVFMLGIISGVAVVGLWRREIRAYAAESTGRIRSGTSRRRAVQDTEERVREALRPGQKAIRRAATTGKA
jgi:hypothetical protein